MVVVDVAAVDVDVVVVVVVIVVIGLSRKPSAVRKLHSQPSQSCLVNAVVIAAVDAVAVIR